MSSKLNFSERLMKCFSASERHIPESIMVTIHYPSDSKFSSYSPKFTKIPDRSSLINKLEETLLRVTYDGLDLVGDEYPSRSEVGLEVIPDGVFEEYSDDLGRNIINELLDIIKSADPKARAFIEIVHHDKTHLTN